MTTKEVEMELAYVLGESMQEKTGEHKTIELGGICEEWKKYKIIGFGSTERNGTWFLYYDGPFGASKCFSVIMEINEGLSVLHTVHIIMQCIQCHRSEVK